MKRKTMRVQELVGRSVYIANGKNIGHVHDVVAEKLEDELCVVGLMVGPAAWLERLGWTRREHGRMVRWEDIASLEPRITLIPGAEQEK